MQTHVVQIDTNYNVTLPLPLSIQKMAKLRVGDFLEAKIEGMQITLSLKHAIDQEIEFAFEDIKQGKGIGPFKTAKEAIRALHREVKKYKLKK